MSNDSITYYDDEYCMNVSDYILSKITETGRREYREEWYKYLRESQGDSDFLMTYQANYFNTKE